MQLSEIIIQKIKKDGSIAFRDFMEMALYYPQLGYYNSDRIKIGMQGDYYTSSNLTASFGIMVARQLEEMWELLGKGEFTIVEYGAGTGLLSHDILDHLKSNQPLYDKLKYCIIEKSPVMREKERTHLSDKVSWYNSIEEIGEIRGCILSNELLDNFAVHQVIMGDELMEVFVDYQNGFTEIALPASEEIKNYFEKQEVILTKGSRTEVNLQAIEWIKEVAAALSKGFVLTIDYGHPSSELYSGRGCSSTLICYYNHSINEDPYCNIGEQDITCHVNFSALCHWGHQNGLDFCGFTSQSFFLRGLGFLDHLRELEKNNSIADKREKVLLMQELLIQMGSKLKVLIQSKGINQTKLSGLKFPMPMSGTWNSSYA